LQLGTDVRSVSLNAAYTLSHFRFRDFVSGTTQLAGNSIPGIPKQQLQGSAAWHVGKAFVLGEAIAKSKVFVNDANGAAAPGFAIFNARVGGRAAFGRPWLSPVAGVQNIFDRHYIGSVAVNAAGTTIAATKFYEPAPGRTWYIGLSAATSSW
jgi:iron complex outermembrane receptor protein